MRGRAAPPAWCWTSSSTRAWNSRRMSPCAHSRTDRTTPRQQKRRGVMVGDNGWQKTGWIAFFILPSLVGMLLFVIGPIIASAVLTLFEWDLLTDPEFV